MPTRGSFNNWTELIRPAHRIVTGIAYLATLNARSESRQCRLASGFSAAQIGNEPAIQTTQQRGLQSAPAMDSLTEIRMFRMSMSAKARLQSYNQADDESALPRRAHSKRSRDEQRDGGRHIFTVSDGAIGTDGAPARTDCGRDCRGLPRRRCAKAGMTGHGSKPTRRLFQSQGEPGAGRESSARQKWSEWQDLNLRPPRPERGALPDCATLRLVAGL